MTRNFAFSEGRERGTWKNCLHEGRRTATVICPDCAERLLLNPHVIDARGRVSPSVVCHTPKCFHEFIELEDWVDAPSIL